MLYFNKHFAFFYIFVWDVKFNMFILYISAKFSPLKSVIVNILTGPFCAAFRFLNFFKKFI